MLIDSYGRTMNYLRLAVTDRCNLRCFYCMPEQGIDYVKRQELLTFEEMERLVHLLYKEGVSKLRITGGEPFLRKGLMEFLEKVSKLENLKIHITTNGTLVRPHLKSLKSMGITSFNLSLDSLDKDRFYQITRRDELEEVIDCMEEMIDLDFHVKINMVVMKSKNVDDILPMALLAKNKNVDIRFLEEMPFNGSDRSNQDFFNHIDIYSILKGEFPSITKTPTLLGATSTDYSVDGFEGRLGIIASYSRTFCGTCNRIRLTPLGLLKTCLYDSGIFNVKNLIRTGATDEQLVLAIQDAIKIKAKDGFEAEKKRWNESGITESMASIGG